MLARLIAATIIVTLLASCDPTPAPATELNDRIGRVHDEIWSDSIPLDSERAEDSLPKLEAAISRISKRHGERSVAMVQALTEAGSRLVGGTNRHDLAIPFIQRSLALSRKLYGDEHRETAYALHDLAVVYAGADLSRYGPEAEAALREALRIREKLLGAGHEETAGAKAALARQLLDRWKEQDPDSPHLEEVEELASDARRILEPSRGSIGSETVALRRTLLECALVRKDYALAEKRARESIGLSDFVPTSGRFPDVSPEDLLARILAAKAQDSAAAPSVPN